MADPARPVFDPVDTTFDPTAVSARDDVESPSLTSGNALARFEFEPGRSKDGTKVLMVEWEDDASTAEITDDWEISWEGKKTTLPARGSGGAEQQQQQQSKSQSQSQHPPQSPHDPASTPVNRLYFLLGPGIPVPGTVQLSKGSTISWRTNPLPAIFPPELGATARQSGKKGVLHTIWAKKRLQVLSGEISAELRDNTEGIALQMAMAEKEWIETNFGVAAKPQGIVVPSSASSMAGALSGSNVPASPRSPGGGRLMDKLKGLRIGTSAQELAGSSTSGNAGEGFASSSGGGQEGSSAFANPLSPETSDVAVGGGVFGSFAALKGAPPPPSSQQQAPRKITAQLPPDSLLAAQQRQEAGGMSSLNAFASANTPSTASSITPKASDCDRDDSVERDDLFALPMSPRSPEMTKSPFSFGAGDTMRYLRGERAS